MLLSREFSISLSQHTTGECVLPPVVRKYMPTAVNVPAYPESLYRLPRYCGEYSRGLSHEFLWARAECSRSGFLVISASVSNDTSVLSVCSDEVFSVFPVMSVFSGSVCSQLVFSVFPVMSVFSVMSVFPVVSV